MVAPTSVVPNWVREAGRFAPELRGRGGDRYAGAVGRTIEQVADADVLVTTYTLFRLEVDAYRRCVGRTDPR